MRSSVGTGSNKEAGVLRDILRYVLMVVASAILAALAELLRPKKPSK